MLPYLDNYPNRVDALKIYNGFRFGFQLHYSGPVKSYESKNLKSAMQNPSIVQDKIQKEIHAGRVGGPFRHPPLNNFRVSPLGLVPKKEPGDFRLIHHLSYPKGESVNDNIDHDLCSVQYTRFDSAVEMVQRLGPGAMLAKADIKSAFRLLPVAKEDFKLLGFKFGDHYYFDKALPFGCSISCAIFETFARFLEWVIRINCPVGELEHYLDDFLFGGRSGTAHCQMMLSSFHAVSETFGVPIASEKTEGPTTVLVFLGLELDSILMQVRIPLEKIKLIITQIQDILRHKRSVTLKELQSLLGSLNFMCRAVVPGRPFCRRLIDATCGVTSRHHFIRLKPGMRQDLKMWLRFFRHFNGVSIFHDSAWQSNTVICLFTDSSSTQGFGAYFKGRWSCAAWPEDWLVQGRTNDITLLEYFPILVSLYIWGDNLRNKKVLFQCDNMTVVHVINRQTSKSPDLMVLVRALTLKCLQLNLVLRAEFIRGVHNEIADSLSRFQMSRFRALAPEAEEHMDPMPPHLWRIFELEPDSY